MAWSLINSLNAGSTGGGTFTSGSQDTTGATFLFCAVASFQNATEPTLSDSESNTWTGHTAQASTGTNPCRLRMFWVDSATPTTDASHTVTITGVGSFGGVAFAAWSGSAANPDDQFATAAVSGFSPSAAAITPSENNCLVVATLSHLANTTPAGTTIDSGLTIIEARNYSAGNSYPVFLAWRSQATAASIDPIWTVAQNLAWAVQVASFKSDGVAAPSFNALLIQP